MITDTDRLNWLIENEAYGFIDSDNYQNFYEATINDAVTCST